MKGTFFQRPLEFQLQVEGESWRQGDSIAGTLVVKNHGADGVDLSQVQVMLAEGELSKVRQKSADAFTKITSAGFEGTRSLASGQEDRLPWKFQTDRNCSITDKSSSLFLVYGQGEGMEKLGQLQINVLPFWVIQECVGVFQSTFHFALKSQKSTKAGVEIKLMPPSAKSFAAVENLVLKCRFKGEALKIRYVFNIKKVEAAAGTMDLKKQKKEFDQSFEPNEYLVASGRFNHEKIEAAIQEVLGQLSLGTFVST